MTARIPWTWAEINQDWLVGSQVALPPEVIVDAFTRVEAVLGREWIDAARLYSGTVVRGTGPTLHVVTVGQMLASLQGVGNTSDLIDKLRGGDASPFAELAAVHLIRLKEPNAIIELEPAAQVGDHNRKPDFRIRRNGEAWSYVEVTQPDVADAQKRAEAVLNRFADLIRSTKKEFALEIVLRHEPTESEVAAIADLVPQLCLLEGNQTKDLPGLAILSVNASAPGQAVLLDHPGEPNVPRLGCVKAVRGPDEPHRHISVRMPRRLRAMGHGVERGMVTSGQ
jgi:hypothetical protein